LWGEKEIRGGEGKRILWKKRPTADRKKAGRRTFGKMGALFKGREIRKKEACPDTSSSQEKKKKKTTKANKERGTVRDQKKQMASGGKKPEER